ncbi:MAG: DUF3617 domain-containing protein [Sphingobium sp.]
MVSAVAAPPHEGPPPMRALEGIERGLWELRDRSAGRGSPPAARLCVRDPAQLIHVRHRGLRCRNFVVMDNPGRGAVTYQCEDSGTGRTDLRVETSHLVQIQTQGIADGAPFSLALEARWVGRCR